MATPSTSHPPAAFSPPSGQQAQAQAQRQAYCRRKARARGQRDVRRQEVAARVEALPVQYPDEPRRALRMAAQGLHHSRAALGGFLRRMRGRPGA